MDIGETWNESATRRDELTGRTVRALTTRGRINQTPTYHTNSGFSADSRFLVFASVREGATWIVRAEAATGELKALWRAPGVGDRNYIHRGMALDFDDVDGRGVCGNRVCIAPRSGLAVFTCERSVIAVDIETCQSRVLLEDCGREWIFGAPAVSPDETHVAIALSSAHPQILAGQPVTRGYRDYGDHRLRLIRVPTDGSGGVEVLYEHAPAQSAHCAFCPTDGNLLYFDLDLPPGYWGGGDGATPRIWLLDLTTGGVRPLKTDYPGAFQVHQAWLWDGSGMCYHGGLAAGGGYFGIAAVDGRTLWERCYPQATFYGHNTPDARRRALIIDGCFTDNLLQWLYYDEGEPGSAVPRVKPVGFERSGVECARSKGPSEVQSPRVLPVGTAAEPKLEPICAHNTEWRSIPGQYSHPHPLTDPAGRWVSFTAARGGRSDVYVVEV